MIKQKKIKKKFIENSFYGMSIIFLLGLAITAFLYKGELNSVEQRIKSVLKEESLERAQAIKQEINENLNINIAIAAFYQASNEVTREEFSIFVTRYFDTHPGIQALEWIPIVKSSEKEEFIKRAQADGFLDFQFREKNREGEMVPVEPRAEYYPVYYAEPFSGNEKALGFDLGSNPARLDAISKAVNSGKLTVTGRINLIQKSNIEPGILVFEPIYENPAKGQINRNSQVTEGSKVIGFALGVYSIIDLLASALIEYPDVGLDISLFDLSAPSGSEFLTAINNLKDNQDLTRPHSLSALKEGIHFSKRLAVADRRWEIVFTPRKEFLEAIPDNSIFILISGIFMTLASMIIYGIIFVNIKDSIKAQLQIENIAKELRLYIETANTPIFGVDIDGCVNEWNQMAEKLSGYKKKEVLGKNLVSEFITEDLRESIKEVFVKALNGQETSNFEFPFYTKKGERVIILLSASTRRDIEGNIIGVIGIGQDITEKNLAQEKTESIALELRQFIETANAPIFGVDINGEINEWNEMAEKLIGYKKKEVLGKNLVSEFITDDFKESVKEVFGKALNGQETSNYEFPLYTKKGERVMILLNASTRRDVEGNIIGVMGIGQDITENIKYRDHLEESIDERTKELSESLADTEVTRDRIDGILKSIADGLVVTDMKNRVIMMNKAAEDMLGIRFSEAVNKPIELAVEDETLREKISETLAKKIEGYSFDFEWGADNDSKEILRARTSVILDKRGKQTGIITIFHNVTQEREVDRMKDEFISMAAHELRTPLTSIRGFSEILLTRDNLKQSDKTKYLGYIQSQSETLSAIISDLLDISRIESGRSFILQKQKCFIGEAINQAVKSFETESIEGNIRVRLPEMKIELMADKEKMAQVLENIISNAIKYSSEVPEIYVTGEIIDGFFQVSVEDKGIGMTPEQLGNIYDKFYRADASNTAVTGTGLGMSIAKAIIEAHDGELWVESEFGKGTKVSFKLPLPNISGSIKGKRKAIDDKIVSKELN